MKDAAIGALMAALVVLMVVIATQLAPRVSQWLAALGVPVPESLLEKDTPNAPRTDLPKTADSFTTAKRWLDEKVYYDHRQTFYCDCDYNEAQEANLQRCGVRSRKNEPYVQQVEADHIFSPYRFGYYWSCWRAPVAVCGEPMSGLECCERTDPVFQKAHNDLHNLYPVITELKVDRSNYRWGIIPGEERDYGVCNIEIDHNMRRVEPPEAIMGDIARSMLYMQRVYDLQLSAQQKRLFASWNREDPPDAWERERNRRIKEIQGRGNYFVENF
jgi:deoxyribonuclease-1